MFQFDERHQFTDSINPTSPKQSQHRKKNSQLHTTISKPKIMRKILENTEAK